MANQQPQIINQANQQNNQLSKYVQPQLQDIKQQQQVQNKQPDGQPPQTVNKDTNQGTQLPIQLSQKSNHGHQQTIQNNQLPVQSQQMLAQEVVQKLSGIQQNIPATPQNIPTQHQYVTSQQKVGQEQGQSVLQEQVLQVASQQQIQDQVIHQAKLHQQQPQQLRQTMSQVSLQQQSSQQHIQAQSFSQTQPMTQQQLQDQGAVAGLQQQSLPVAGLNQQIQQLPQQQQQQLSQKLSEQSLTMVNHQPTQSPVQSLSQQIQGQSMSQVPSVLLQGLVSQAMQHQTLQKQQLQQVLDPSNMQQMVNQTSVSQHHLLQQQQSQQFQGAQYYGQIGTTIQMLPSQNRGVATATISSTSTPILSLPLQQQTMLPQASAGVHQPSHIAAASQQIQQQQLQQLQQQQQHIQQQIQNQHSLNAYPSQQFLPVQQQQQQQQQFPVQHMQFVHQQFPMHQVSLIKQFPVQHQLQQPPQQQDLQQHKHLLVHNYQQQCGQQCGHVNNVSQAPAFGGILGIAQGNPTVQQMPTLTTCNYLYQAKSSNNQSEPYCSQTLDMTVTSSSPNRGDGNYVVGNTTSQCGTVPPTVQQTEVTLPAAEEGGQGAEDGEVLQQETVTLCARKEMAGTSTADGEDDAEVAENSSSASSDDIAVDIDTKIAQALDLVKSHLIFTVGRDVEALREKIAELTARLHPLELENALLRSLAAPETLTELSTLPSQQPSESASTCQPQPSGSGP